MSGESHRPAVNGDQITVGEITPAMKNTLVQNNVDIVDTWGYALAPNDQLNPNKGSYYIGLAEKDKDECSYLIDTEVTRLERNESEQSTHFQLYLASNCPENLDKFAAAGKLSTIKHEKTHIEQNKLWGYRDMTIGAIGKINELFDNDNVAAANKIINTHAHAYLLSEIHALNKQITDIPDNPEDIYFSVYWMSKVGRLFENKEQNLREVFKRLSSNNNNLTDIPNGAALTSRALLLTRDPDILQKLENNQITYEEFRSKVEDGITSFMNSPIEFGKSLRSYNQHLEKNFETSITRVKEELNTV